MAIKKNKEPALKRLEKTIKPSKKNTLEKKILPKLKEKYTYFSYEDIRTAFENNTGEKLSNTTLKIYISKLTEQGVLFDAGKGWYSSLEVPLVLDDKPLQPIKSFLNDKFPLLETACWSTQQINPFMHHLLSKFTTFVYAPRDAMDVVGEALRDAGHSVLVNPGKQEIEKQYPSLNSPIIMRPFSEEESSLTSNNTRLEWVLINFLFENKRLLITSQEEAKTAANKAVMQGRANIAQLASYAKRKRINIDMIYYLHKNEKCGDSI